MNIKSNIFLTLVLFSHTACFNIGKPAENASGASLLSISLPEGAGQHYDAYRISITAMGTSTEECSPTYETTDSVSSQNVGIEHKVNNGCNYLIALDLGQMADGNFTATYTNTNNQAKGTLVKKEQLTGNEVEVPVTVFKITGASSNESDPDALSNGVSKLDIGVTIAEDESPPVADASEEASSTSPVSTSSSDKTPPATTNSEQNGSATALANENVQAIFNNKCLECHHATGLKVVNLSSFPYAAPSLDNDQKAIAEMVIHTVSGSSATMPPAPRTKITAAELKVIRDWAQSLP